MNPFLVEHSGILLLLALWTLPWKIYALWTAAKRNDRRWFVALVVFNTFAIIEIFYIFYVAKKSWHEVQHAFRKALSLK